MFAEKLGGDYGIAKVLEEFGVVGAIQSGVDGALSTQSALYLTSA